MIVKIETNFMFLQKRNACKNSQVSENPWKTFGAPIERSRPKQW